MKYVVCSIRDHAAEFYGQPFFAPSKGAAIRSFTDAVNDKSSGNQFAAHPADFDLFHIGDFDSDSGELFPCKATRIAQGVNVKVD